MKTMNRIHARRLSDEALIRLVRSGQEHVYGVLIKRLPIISDTNSLNKL